MPILVLGICSFEYYKRKHMETLAGETVNMRVTDLNMPNVDGINLIRQISTKAGNRFMPIIMLTTESQPEKRVPVKPQGLQGGLPSLSDRNNSSPWYA